MSAPVTVWVVPPEARVDLGCLTVAERAAAAKLHTAAARHRHRRSRAVLRHAVAAATGQAPGDVPLVAPPGTRPRVAERGAPGVSLAHAGGTIAVAVCPSGPVGVDVEVASLRSRPVPAPVVTDARISTVAGLVDEPLAPLAVWVLLEAALKASGTGFRRPQQSVAFTRTPTGVELHLPGAGTHHGVVRSLAGDVLLAVVTSDEPPAVRLVEGLAGAGLVPRAS